MIEDLKLKVEMVEHVHCAICGQMVMLTEESDGKVKLIAPKMVQVGFVLPGPKGVMTGLKNAPACDECFEAVKVKDLKVQKPSLIVPKVGLKA